MESIDTMLDEFAEKAKTPNANQEEPKTDAVETKTDFDYVSHYKGLGIEAATREEAEGQIKEVLTKYGELKDYPTKYEATQQELNQLKEKNELLSQQVNPLSYFSSEDAYVREQLAKKHPDYDASVLTKALGDTTKLTDIEVLVLGKRLTDGDIYQSDAKAIAEIESTYGIDLSTDKFEDLPIGVQTRIQKESKNLKQTFNSLRSEVELPKAVDTEAMMNAQKETLRQQSEQTKAEWKPFVDTLPTQLDKVALKDGEEVLFEYAIDDVYKQEVAGKAQQTLDFIASKGIKVTDAAKAAIVEDLKNAYLVNNLSKIVKTYTNNKIAETTEQQWRELHNAQGPNKATGDGKTALEGSTEAAEQKVWEHLKPKFVTKL